MNTISKLFSKKTKFKDKYTFEQRSKESSAIKLKYPNRVPCILERSGTNIDEMDKKKFLIPKDLTVGQFIFVVRQRLALDASRAIFLFFNSNTLVNTSETIGCSYINHSDKDGSDEIHGYKN